MAVVGVHFLNKTHQNPPKTMQKGQQNYKFSAQKNGASWASLGDWSVEQETQKSLRPAVTWDYPFAPT
jgi:hypothetical protein